MATTRIKDKVSAVVSNQLPEYIKSDYDTFVSFVEAYYRFVEQDQGAYEIIKNAQSYSDIDTTTEAFVNYFIKNYSKDYPLTSAANKRLLIKKIKDLYEAKGSTISFKMLFNLLYEIDVELEYPYNNVLKASSGTWQQKNSLHLKTLSGSRDVISNRYLDYTSNGISYSTPITESVVFNDDITEVFLDPRLLAPSYNVGDTVYVTDGSNTVFTGQVSPTITSYSISSGGQDFKVGQIFYINYEGGQGSLVQVSNVSTIGGITGLNFLTFGGNYSSSPFSIQFISSSTVAVVSDGFTDKTKGFKSEGAVYHLDPTDSERYFDIEYVSGNSYTITGNVETFQNNVFNELSTTSSTPPGYATITFIPGALGRYPGSYTTNEGFLSELDVRVQDELRYQPYAYQLDSPLDISFFYDTIRGLIHPAGQRLFNNRILTTVADVSANVSVNIIPFITQTVIDTFAATESHSLFITKIETDTTNNSDNTSYVLTKPLVESTAATEFVAKEIQPVYSDNVATVEATIIDITKQLSDVQIVIEQLTQEINKPINNSVNTNDELSVYLDDFFAEDYTEEVYAGTPLV